MQVQEELDTGYRDSTSLEQIADWLTKIIVGLTLTQFASWAKRFDILASNLTDAMMGPSSRSPECAKLIAGARGTDVLGILDLPLCRASPVPGGAIIALYAFGGFLASYLWMRRYFILEMVMAKRQAINTLKRERQSAEADRRRAEEQTVVKAAREAALAETSPSRALISDPELADTLDLAAERFGTDSPAQKTLSKIRKRVEDEITDPDDPWRGKFGETSGGDDLRLEASVSPLADDPSFFKVDLSVRALGAVKIAQLLGSKVVYFLHPTFGEQPRISYFGSDGQAPIEIFAYGAFTVGALLEDGTALELNLATVQGAPHRFIAQ